MGMDPEKIMVGLAKELGKTLKDMGKAKNLEERERYSNIVRNLSESLGVFLGLASDMMDYGDEPFPEDFS